MKLYVIFSIVDLQKETFGAFYIKFYLKHIHKNGLKATQNPQKQPPADVLKKAVLKNFAKLAGQHLCLRLFINKVAGDSITGFFLWILRSSEEHVFCSLPKATSESLETTTIPKSLETCHKYKFIRRTMLRH